MKTRMETFTVRPPSGEAIEAGAGLRVIPLLTPVHPPDYDPVGRCPGSRSGRPQRAPKSCFTHVNKSST